MLRIWIDWDFISPSLGAVSGIAKVHYVQDQSNWILLCKFKVKCKPGMVGYTSEADGIPTLLYDAIKPQLDQMVRSFRDGISLQNTTFTWVHLEESEKANMSLEQIEEKYKNEKKIFEVVEEGDYSLSPLKG
jgi:hypothetical protein